ncbi:MAG TPA: SpoIIE family protein phosphatase [Methanospirillum sp.]|uniref:SpoIIE family protein phosphatase n=1 Tax=Methanospirillum sp. TaxID=45200 RepID=UPI002CA5CFDB|nr:SpoIIE family protein phosphatase [Methanospirillum sp.]HOJ97054.1 SpoIIE family protein phosphatase [Methanospirillum sp.]HPP77331.1 SpoIIE family protein phosphatase [Methanospirillum sp.]
MRFGVTVKLLLIMVLLTSLIFLIIGGISWIVINNLGNYATESSLAFGERAIGESTTALEEDAEIYLLRLATDQAEITNMVFEQIISEMKVINDYGKEIIRKNNTPVEWYSRDTRPTKPGETGVIHLSPNRLPEDVRDEIYALNSFQPVFNTLFHADNRLTALYVTSSSGVTYIFPWTPRIDPNFEPRARDWYRNALNSTQFTWTDPYVDALGNGLAITCSKAIHNPGMNVSWVIGSDITIETINYRIITTQLGEDGYAFLINQRGDIISRPGLSAGEKRWDDSFETDNLLLSSNEDLKKIAQEMTMGLSGVSRCRFAEGDKYIAFAPVKSVGWSIGLVMPVEQVTGPAHITGSIIRNASEETHSHITKQMSFLQTILIASFILLFITVVGIALFFSKFITNPLMILSEGARRIGNGDLQTPVEIQSGDEFEELAGAFNRMMYDLRNYIVELRRTTAEKERFTRELEIAQGIQQSFLPDSVPDIPGMELAVYASPALEVGGDFYDFIPVGDDEWGLVIADVSGKGVPAALFMALSRTLIRVSATWRSDPASAIKEANSLICRDSKASMFVTLFYLVIDNLKRKITYVNAGHNPPLMLTGQDSDITLLRAEGIALGIIDEIDLDSNTVDLKKGDLVTLYTDGVTEAMNKDGEEYGMERFITVLKQNRDRELSQLIEAIIASIKDFTKDAPQSDDITLILIRAS